MSNVNPKQIKTRHVNELYDLVLLKAQTDPTVYNEELTAEQFALQTVSHHLTAIKYPMAQNVSQLLQGYNAKVIRDGVMRSDANSATPEAVALYADIFKSAPPADPKNTQATQAPAINAAPAAKATTAPPSLASEAPSQPPTCELEMKSENTAFTFKPELESNLDLMVATISGNAVTSLRALLNNMVEAEAVAAEAAKSNQTMCDAIDAYTQTPDLQDAPVVIDMPAYESKGFASLSTTNPTIQVLDTLITQGLHPAISYNEIISRIAFAETAYQNEKVAEKSLQREYRRVRPKVATKVKTESTVDIAVAQMAFADELNANVQVVYQLGTDVFTGTYGQTSEILGFEVPTLEFDDAHPDVPKVDPNFRFLSSVLAEALHTIAEDEIMWLYGDSGCGKTQFWEQVAARLNMPFTRLNLDGHLTRLDIIGVNRMLPNEDRQMEMRFVEGILARAMSRPGIMLLDEFDLGDPELMPVLQPVLEGKNLVLLEDGGRVVQRHPLFRIAITGNTIGLGSANQMYNNAHEQSAATRDRISSFVRMEYMPPDIEFEVTMARVPNADPEFVKRLITLANKTRSYFGTQVYQLFSSRAVLACAKRYARFAPLYNTPEEAADEVIRTVILNRMDDASHNVTKGLVDNIFA